MSDVSKNKVAVLGAGISGLATAWFLEKRGFDVTIFEAEKSTGGVIRSENNEYSVFDFGPNSIRDKSGRISEIIKELELEEDVIRISEAGKVRFIVRDGKLEPISPNPFSLLNSGILSIAGKLRLISEPFRKKSVSNEDESIGDFLERRLGKEAADYLADPFFSGIYAGDIYAMSKNRLLKKLSDFEINHGSIVKGFLKERKSDKTEKPKVLSFKKGVQQLTDDLTRNLGSSIKYEKVKSLESEKEGFLVKTETNQFHFDQVVSCLPSYALTEILSDEFDDLKSNLKSIEYAPMLSTQVVYKAEKVSAPNKGFGFLVPREENVRLLGAIWKSNIFPEQSENGLVHFNLMTGGAHDLNVLTEDQKDVEEEILGEFKKIMNIEADPMKVSSYLWEKAIPQFHVGFKKIDQKITEAEKKHSGFYIRGNYRWGISVSDCVDGAFNLASGL